MKLLRETSIDCIESLADVVGAVDAQVYRDSGMGKHIRHVIDHFLALRNSLESKRVDYNVRTRGSKTERSVKAAMESMADIVGWLNENCDDMPVTMISEISATEQVIIEQQSTLAREFNYVVHHTIHHTAYCVLLAKQYGVALNADIGLAPATASYQRAELCKKAEA